jgi:hypothetical protein
MEMLRLNVRHTLPQTDLRIKHGKIDRAKYQPAQVHTNSELGRSNQHATQVLVAIDNYPSRRSLGARNLTDLTREFGQKGLSDVKAGTSRRTKIAWERAENGGKPGNDIIPQIKNEIYNIEPKTLVEFELMDAPTFTVNPSRIVGKPEVGDVTAEIETEPFAQVHYTPGIFETYLKNKGSIKRWVTMDKYDIYA